jgi:NADH-quinone oxidoreductase subunit M
MGFILLGLMTLNQIGLSGAVIQMFSHGILAGLLFAVVGRMVYARTHTRELAVLGPMNLNKAIPFAAVTFVLAGMASMGLPGFSGFVAELMIVLGAWHAFPALAICVGFGILIGIVYVWRAMQNAFFAEGRGEPIPPDHPLPPISLPERLGAIILIGTSVLIGIYPQLLLNIIVPALNSPMFEGLRKGSWQ